VEQRGGAHAPTAGREKSKKSACSKQMTERTEKNLLTTIAAVQKINTKLNREGGIRILQSR